MGANPIISSHAKTAIVLFNLGGPDSVEAVRPFLYNLFSDRAIIDLPGPLRRFIAARISKKRAAKKAIPIYEKMGGKSPILENTRAQADALKTVLSRYGNVELFVCMRYWHPMAEETARAVKQYGPDRIILLPLYPQYSTTTTASSVKDFKEHAQRIDLYAPMHEICCYPTQPEFIAAQIDLIRPLYEAAKKQGTPRLLLSAHGLPEKIIKKGDPYQWQVEQTSTAIIDALGIEDVDAVTCYQSRVGPLKWIGPDTEAVIRETAARGQPIVLVPVAFVSEHSETLVELDIDYRAICDALGMPHYYRVPTVSMHPRFIEGLKNLCLMLETKDRLCSQRGRRLCGSPWKHCPHDA